MGRNISTGLDAVEQPVSLTAQGTIAAGDLVKVDAGGWVQKVTDAFPGAAQNTALGVTAAGQVSLATGYGYAGNPYMGLMRNVAPLPDGGFASAFAGSSGSSTAGANVGFHGASGVLRQMVVVSGASTTGPARVVRAGADNVAVVWSESTDLRLAVVNYTTGAIVQASLSVGAVTASDLHSWNVAPLPNGEVVVAYPSSGSTAFKRFNASGAIQGAEVIAETGQTPLYFTILPLTVGGFVVRWAKTAATQGNRMARFNAAGVLQGGVVAISSAASAYDGVNSAAAAGVSGAMEGKLIELSNGYIVSTHIDTATTQGFKVYDSTLTLLSTVPLGAAAAQYQDVIQLAPKFGGGFWLCCLGSGLAGASTRVHELNNAGQLVRFSTVGVPYPLRILDRPGNGPLILCGSHASGTPSSSASHYAFALGLATEAAATVMFSLNSIETSTLWPEILASGMLACAFTNSTGPQQLYMAYAGGASIVGVAQGAAAVGQSVRVATAGKLAMNQNLATPPFDRRASTPVGTKGTTIGNVAILNGLNG